jgi:hypothetical protein
LNKTRIFRARFKDIPIEIEIKGTRIQLVLFILLTEDYRAYKITVFTLFRGFIGLLFSLFCIFLITFLYLFLTFF